MGALLMVLYVASGASVVLFVTIVMMWRSLCRRSIIFVKGIQKPPVADVPNNGASNFVDDPVAVTVVDTPFIDFDDSGVSSLSAMSVARRAALAASTATSSPTAAATFNCKDSDADETYFSEAGYSDGSSDWPTVSATIFSPSFGEVGVSSIDAAKETPQVGLRATVNSAPSRSWTSDEPRNELYQSIVDTKESVRPRVPAQSQLSAAAMMRWPVVVQLRIEAERHHHRESAEGDAIVLNSVHAKVVTPAMAANDERRREGRGRWRPSVVFRDSRFLVDFDETAL